MPRAFVAQEIMRSLVMLVSTMGSIFSSILYCLDTSAFMNWAYIWLSSLNWRLVRLKSLSMWRILA